jgi:hypothetical protein
MGCGGWRLSIELIGSNRNPRASMVACCTFCRSILEIFSKRASMPSASFSAASSFIGLGDAVCPLADSATSKLPAAATATAAAAYSDTTAATAAAAYNDTTAAATTAAATHGAASHGAASHGAATRGAGTLGGDLVTKLRLGALLVEDIEGRQADVGKLFLAEDRKDRIIAILVHGRAQLASR